MTGGKPLWDKGYAKIKILVIAAIFFGVLGVPFSADATFVSGNISTDTIWTKAESPYIITTNIKVNTGVTLTLEPGVIVKVQESPIEWQDTYFDIYGKLIAVGTESERIYFTSAYNDELGGDTNGGGDLMSPSQFDTWMVRFFHGSEGSELNHVFMNYSAYGFIFSSTSANLNDIVITDNANGISVIKSVLTIANSDFYNLEQLALDVYLDCVVTVTDSIIDDILYWPISVGTRSKLFLSNVIVSNIALDYAATAVNNSTISIASSTFTGGLDGGIGVFDFSSANISSSTIKDFVEEGIFVADGSYLTIENSIIQGNESGIILANRCENCSPLYKEKYRSFLTARGNAITDNNSFGFYMTPTNTANAANNWWGHSSGPKNISTNPDGLGDLVSDGVDFIPWLTSDPFVTTPDPVIIIPGILGSAEKDGVWLIDPIFHTYDDLIATLVANGYVQDQIPGQNLFTFPYDWRFSNVLTAVELKDKIAEVKNICQCEKVDLVAHSMGGLVARQYIQSPQYAGDIDQLIFLGTPHLGAPKAYYPWEGATVPPNDPVYSVIKFMLWADAFKLDKSLYDYIRQDVLSIKELLPIYDYLTLKDSGVMEKYPNGYPTNSFLENLSADTNQLLNSGVEITNIIGNTGNSTITSITVASSTDPVLWEHGKPEVVSYGEGDETVPITSAVSTFSDSRIFASRHNKLPTIAEGEVYKELTTKDATILIDDWDFPDFKLLLVKILSPADIVVIAPDNKRIGKDFATGQEVNEIPGAFYSGFLTDDEYITIPNPLLGEYKVVTQGTGEGSYTIATGYISDDFSVNADFVGQTVSGMINEINLQIATSSLGVKITPEDIIADIEKCLELGWIDNKGIANSLIKKKKDKAFLNELNAQRGKHINEQAYQILSEDIKWLLAN